MTGISTIMPISHSQDGIQVCAAASFRPQT